MSAAVDPDEHARLGHPFAPAAVPGWSSTSHRRQAGLGEHPSQRPFGDADAFPLGEQVREVGRVHLDIRGRGQLDESIAQRVIESVGWDATPVAVDQGRCSLIRAIPGQQPPHRADRQTQVCGRLGRTQFASQYMVEHQESLLRSLVQRDRLPRRHMTEGDEVAGRLGVTDSLAVHTARSRA